MFIFYCLLGSFIGGMILFLSYVYKWIDMKTYT